MLPFFTACIIGLQGFASASFHEALLVPRVRRSTIYLFYAGMGFLLVLFRYQFPDSEILISGAILVAYPLIAFYLFQGGIKQKLLVTALYYVMQLITEMLSLLLSVFLFSMNSDLYMPSVFSWQRTATTILSLVLQYTTVILLWRVLRKAGKRFTLPFSGFAVLLCASQMVLFLAMFSDALFGSLFAFSLFGVIGGGVTIVTDVVALRIIHEAQQKRETQERLVRMEEVYSAKLAAYQNVQEKTKLLAKLRHDVAGHLRALAALVEQQKNKEACDYIAQLTQGIGETALHQYTSHVVADAIISNIAEQCEQQDIPLQAEVSMPSELALREVHICSVLSNLLGNAQKASLALPVAQRGIVLKIGYAQECWIVKCKNRYDPEAASTGGTGYGTQILSDIAALYSGTYTVEKIDGWYCTSLVLPARG